MDKLNLNCTTLLYMCWRHTGRQQHLENKAFLRSQSDLRTHSLSILECSCSSAKDQEHTRASLHSTRPLHLPRGNRSRPRTEINRHTSIPHQPGPITPPFSARTRTQVNAPGPIHMHPYVYTSKFSNLASNPCLHTKWHPMRQEEGSLFIIHPQDLTRSYSTVRIWRIPDSLVRRRLDCHCGVAGYV